MRVSADGRSVEVTFTVESIEANAGVFNQFDPGLRQDLLLMGVTFVVSGVVPVDEMWVVSRTEDGALATFKYQMDPPGRLHLLDSTDN